MNVPCLEYCTDLLIKRDKFDAASDLAKIFFLQNSNIETLDFLAKTLYLSKKYQEALYWTEKLIEATNNNPSALNNKGLVLLKLNRGEECEKVFSDLLKLNFDPPSSKLNLSVALCSQGKFKEGRKVLYSIEKDLKKGETIGKNGEGLYYNMGWHLLHDGKFKEGMSNLIRNKKLIGHDSHQYSKPLFDKFIPGKTLLFSPEGGAGDEMLNVRFCKMAKEHGMKTMFASNHKLQHIFSRVPFVDHSISYNDLKDYNFDYYVPMMKASVYLDACEKDVTVENYLSASPVFSKKHQLEGKLKIGIRWQGNPLYEQDLSRSIPFHLFEQITSLPGATVYSLQKDTGLEELSTNSKIIDLSSKMETWEDTAGIIDNLDIVVTSCTSIAHLAGLMGKRTLVLLPAMYYYIWAWNCEESLWHNKNLTTIKQPTVNTWEKSMEKVVSIIKKEYL